MLTQVFESDLEINRQGPKRLCFDALHQLSAVLDAENDRIDPSHIKRIAMREQRWIDAEFGAERAERFGPAIIGSFRVTVLKRAIDRSGQRTGLNRADPHNPDVLRFGRRDDLTRNGGFGRNGE